MMDLTDLKNHPLVYFIIADFMEQRPPPGITKGFTKNFFEALLSETRKFATVVPQRSGLITPVGWIPNQNDGDLADDARARMNADLSVAIFPGAGTRYDFNAYSALEHVRTYRKLLVFSPAPAESHIPEWLLVGLKSEYNTTAFNHTIPTFQNPDSARKVALCVAEKLAEQCNLPENHAARGYVEAQKKEIEQSKPGRWVPTHLKLLVNQNSNGLISRLSSSEFPKANGAETLESTSATA